MLKMGQNLEPFTAVEILTQMPLFLYGGSLGLNK